MTAKGNHLFGGEEVVTEIYSAGVRQPRMSNDAEQKSQGVRQPRVNDSPGVRQPAAPPSQPVPAKPATKK